MAEKHYDLVTGIRPKDERPEILKQSQRFHENVRQLRRIAVRMNADGNLGFDEVAHISRLRDFRRVYEEIGKDFEEVLDAGMGYIGKYRNAAPSEADELARAKARTEDILFRSR